MYWLFLLLALGAFVLAISTTQMWLLVLSLLAALLFAVLWIKGLFAARFSGIISEAPRPLHPAELQMMREKLLEQTGQPKMQDPAPTISPAKSDSQQP